MWKNGKQTIADYTIIYLCSDEDRGNVHGDKRPFDALPTPSEKKACVYVFPQNINFQEATLEIIKKHPKIM